MSKKFTSGSDLYKYECMMQELPFGHVSSKEEKKAKGRYLSILRQFMSDKGFGSIYKKVSENIKELKLSILVDTFFYKDFSLVTFHAPNGPI